ncbi:MAG: ribonuclease J [Candidatus Saccharibacteria bacterium]
MGQQRLANVQGDDPNKRPNQQVRQKSNNTVLNNTTTRKGEAYRAQRRTSENVNQRASQHVINIPVNKSVYNGYDGRQFSPVDQKKQPYSNSPKLKIMPVGGLGEMGIGKNMMAIEYDNDIIVIDCGFLFPGADYPGINYITPDITYLEENKHKIRAHIFTHAHLDHIGAYRHIGHKIPAPVYATKFTIGMIQRTMEESLDDYEPQYNEVNPDTHERVQIGDNFSIEFIRVPHSTPDCAAIVIRTPLGVVVHSGDWRFEDSPVDGKKFDIERLTEIATTEGILLFMNESTNAEVDGTHMHGEFDIQESIGQVMTKYPNSRLILSCFSSHIYRMQLILDEAKKFDRKVAFAGYSMIQNLEVALRTGILKVPKDVVVKMEDLVKLPDSKVTIICTGSQGEFNAVLNRMASGSHKFIKIKNSDVIVFSSNPIPGNEKFVTRTVDGLMREGSDVVQNGKTHLTNIGPLHLSGHAYYSDHAKLISALNPTYYMPIHGEFHMLVHNAGIAENMCGLKRENIFVCDSGDIIEITTEGAKKAGRFPVGGIMYDDSGAIVSEVVLKDRIHMASEGMFVVVLTVQRGSGRLMTSPDIISRGFIYLRDSEELMGMIRQYLKQKVARSFVGKHVDLDVIKKEIKEEITHILYDQTRRTPIVIPVINEVGGSSNNGRSQSQSNANVSNPETAQVQGRQNSKEFSSNNNPAVNPSQNQPKTNRHSY